MSLKGDLDQHQHGERKARPRWSARIFEGLELERVQNTRVGNDNPTIAHV